MQLNHSNLLRICLLHEEYYSYTIQCDDVEVEIFSTSVVRLKD